MAIQRTLRRCNICGLVEPYTRPPNKPEADECGGHSGIHPFLWNLSPWKTRVYGLWEDEVTGQDGKVHVKYREEFRDLNVKSYTDYQKFLVRKKVACGQEVTEVTGSNTTDEQEKSS